MKDMVINMKRIEVNGISIDLQRKKIKNMYLKIQPPDGQVLITAPLRMSEEEIKRFVLSKIDWIISHQEKIKKKVDHREISYLDGEQIFLWGKAYILSVVLATGRPHLYWGSDIVKLYVKKDCTKEQRKQIIDAWYREALAVKIPILIAKWEPIMGVKSSGFSIRDMKTRWGTCNISSKKICLNLQLAKKPPKCLEYVVVHELTHLLEKSHNQVFKGYMDRFLPEWRSIKRELNER